MKTTKNFKALENVLNDCSNMVSRAHRKTRKVADVTKLSKFSFKPYFPKKRKKATRTA